MKWTANCHNYNKLLGGIIIKELVFVSLRCNVILFLFIAVGFLLRKCKVVDDGFGKNISAVLMNFLVPMLIFDVVTDKLNIATLKDGYGVFLISILSIVVIYFVFKLFSHKFSGDPSKNSVFLFAMIFSNFAFIGKPMIEAIYGESAMLSWALFAIPYYGVVNILGMYIIGDKSKISVGKMVLNPNTVAIVLGSILGLCNVKMPSLIREFLGYCNTAVVPLSMILIGFVLGGQKLKEMFVNKRVYLISAIRLLVIPLVVLGVFYIVGFRGLMLYIPTIILAMPVATNGIMLTEDLGGNSLFMAQAVFISTVLSIGTIPLIAGITALIK